MQLHVVSKDYFTTCIRIIHRVLRDSIRSVGDDEEYCANAYLSNLRVLIHRRIHLSDGRRYGMSIKVDTISQERRFHKNAYFDR